MKLAGHLEKQKGFVECIESLRSKNHALFDGVWGSSCALLISALQKHAPSSLVVVTATEKELDLLADDVETFCNEPFEIFPSSQIDIKQPASDPDYGQRIRFLKRITAEQTPPLVLTSIQALLQPVPSMARIAQRSRTLKTGDRIDPAEFQQWLVECGFHHVSGVEMPSEFSVRGGIIDLFAPDWVLPVRIEFFDDEIDSLREFEIESQRSTMTLKEIEVTVVPPSTEDDTSLFDLLPSDSFLLMVEPDAIRDQAKQFLKLVAHPKRFHSFETTRKLSAKFATASAHQLSSSASENDSFDTGMKYCRFDIEPVEEFPGDIGEIRAKLDQVGKGHHVYVVPVVEGEVDRLVEILGTTQIGSRGKLHFPVGRVHHGFRLIKDKVLVVAVDQLFRRGEMRRTARRRLGKAIDSFLDLQEGDLVVHLAHGIGRFRGLELLEKEGVAKEHLALEFHGKTKIYVPASRIDLVQKYIGGAKRRPTLARIGSKSWQKQRLAAEQAVTDLASDMLQVQAERTLRKGISFHLDTDWQQEFERSFPFRETPDQLTSIKEIKADMQSNQPMERLLCGDVGFGKTELAMRAAFKAVENGYQVAMLVPTTVLCEQHYRAFKERMREFPFDIAKLSRFCSTKEMRDNLEGLATGRIDILIGTHRLASKDVKFFNLGLLIIDEEQRFGVEVKERLKSMRSMVDVLTMSATPIPRTLHMSLVGVRDISNLETPPETRTAVETRVTRFDEELIRTAILKELNRGGQIFFVHNRVGDIEAVRDKLARIVPEASVVIGHGQMAEGQLEVVMRDFIEHRYDVLLATTIIESGLDIPNANTIFIDEADRYGLSDLHQLRGRVGRYNRQAYCFLMIDSRKHINPTAAKRLAAIQQYSEMGAGFSIAMRDLEIRGAGNLLGTEQSGHIAMIGYELYCQLLETAVRQLKKLPPKMELNVDIDLPCDAFFPDEFISDKRQKIDLYRRMTRIETFDQIMEINEEIVDRFGELPMPAKRMLTLAELRLDAAIWQINSIFLEDNYLVFKYASRSRIETLAKQNNGRLRVVDETSAYVTLKKEKHTANALLKAVKSILRA